MAKDRSETGKNADRASPGELPGEPVAPSLRQARHSVGVNTRGRSMIEITNDINRWLHSFRTGDGLLTVFLAHTSASLTIQENADPDVQGDLLDALKRLAPEGPHYRHSVEGPDDMPAHIKTMLTSTSLSIPVIGGSMALGTWQGVYVIEHRAGDHARRVELHFIGSMAS